MTEDRKTYIYDVLSDFTTRSKDSFSEELDIRDDLAIDSLAMMEFAFEIEDRFSIVIDDDVFLKCRKIHDVFVYIDSLLTKEKS